VGGVGGGAHRGGASQGCWGPAGEFGAAVGGGGRGGQRQFGK
jgi:hypothetical protein